MSQSRSIATAAAASLAIAFIVLNVPSLPSEAFTVLPSLATGLALMALAVEAFRRKRLTPQGLPLVAYLVCMFGLFALAQRALWMDTLGNPWVWHGLLPWNDSFDYFGEAVGLLVDGEYETLRGRPLHTSSVALLMSVTGFDLAMYSTVVTLLAALACALAGLVVWRDLGLGAAAAFSAVMFAFFHYFVGSLMTETFGFIYGALGFALCWSAARESKPVWFVIAIAAVTIGQCVRVGALLVLPALSLFAALGWRVRGRRFNWRLAAGTLAMAVVLLAAHSQFNRILAPGSGGSFGNAADSLYRLVVQGEVKLGRVAEDRLRGSAPWLQIYDDHPGLNALTQGERVQRKREILFDAVVRSPLAVFAGALPEWNEYFFDFQLLPFPSLYDNDAAELAIAILAVLGLLRVLAPGTQRQRWLVLIINLAIFASVPFLVGGQTRVYAATMGFTAILVALGAHTLSRLHVSSGEPSRGIAHGALGLLAGLVVAALAAPALVGATLNTVSVQVPLNCAAGEEGRVLTLTTSLHLVGREAQPHEGPHVVGRPRLEAAAAGSRKRAPDPFSERLLQALQAEGAPLFIHAALDVKNSRTLMVVTPEDAPIEAGLPQALCLRHDAAIAMARVPPG